MLCYLILQLEWSKGKCCNKKMGLPCLFSPRVPVILSVFTQLPAKCSKLEQLTVFCKKKKKNSFFLVLKWSKRRVHPLLKKILDPPLKSKAFLFRAIIVSKVISKSLKVLQNILKQVQFLIDHYLMLHCGFECGDSRYSYVNKSNFLYP